MLQVKEIALGELHPWDQNPRVNDHAVAAVAESISRFGFNVPIICDQSLTIMAGHTRWKAAQRLQMATVPVIVVEMSDTQRKAFAVADYKTAELADWDVPRLRDVLQSLRSEDVSMHSLGFSDAELRRLLIGDEPDEGPVPQTPNADPATRLGDLYTLGEHRLLCGDSRDTRCVATLTEGHPMDLVYGGPPYYNQRDYSHWDDYGTYLRDMRQTISNCRGVMKAGAVCAWNIANGCSTHHDHVSHHSRLFEECGLEYTDTIIWKKASANYAVPRNFHIARNGVYYPAL